jgi:hypothetical protein
MSDQLNEPEMTRDASHPIDRLVELHFQQRSAEVDCDDLANRILHSMKVVTSTKVAESSPSYRSWFRAAWLVATAAAVLIAFAFGRWENSAFANPVRLVQAARTVHSQMLERCYLVKTKVLSSSAQSELKKSNLASWLPKNVAIWTQGNRFWVEIKNPKRQWAWGRNPEGDVWLALGENLGLQIAASEIGKPLQQICDLHSLEVDALLENLQNRWTLTKREVNDSSYIISAERKRGTYHRLTNAVLELDRETRAVRRLTVRRLTLDGLETETEFVLVETRVPDESLYRLEGHLTEPFQVFNRDALATKRLEILKNWFGSAADSWIR